MSEPPNQAARPMSCMLRTIVLRPDMMFFLPIYYGCAAGG
jgi:hypothetical protein